MSGIVISYRREDSEGSAGRLYDRLVQRYDAKLIFMDYYSIAPAAHWKETIKQTVSDSDVLVAVIGPRWLSAADENGRRRLDDDNDYVRTEIRLALDHEVPVLPVLVQGASMMDASDLPPELAGLTDAQAVRLDTKYFDRDIQDLYQYIDTVVEFRGELPSLNPDQTAVAGFVGLTPAGPTEGPVWVKSWQQFVTTFGGFQSGCLLPHSIYGWFANGGGPCYVVRVSPAGKVLIANDFVGERDTGLAALESRDDITIVAAPDTAALADDSTYQGLEEMTSALLAVIAHCESQGNRLAILDPPPGLNPQQAFEWRKDATRFDTKYAALYYPWIKVFDPQDGRNIWIPPSGHVAGSWAGNDQEKGVWSAPANRPLAGALDLAERPRNMELDPLQRAGINVIRALPGVGIRVWGARTLSSNLTYADISTMRTISSLISLIRGATSWAAFERSTPSIWERLQRSVEAVLQHAWRQGAMSGKNASEAYFVRCDEENNPSELAASGRIRVEFGFAPKIPGEFVWMSVEQPSGDWAIFEPA